jgi:hypothetical protein
VVYRGWLVEFPPCPYWTDWLGLYPGLRWKKITGFSWTFDRITWKWPKIMAVLGLGPVQCFTYYMIKLESILLRLD